MTILITKRHITPVWLCWMSHYTSYRLIWSHFTVKLRQWIITFDSVFTLQPIFRTSSWHDESVLCSFVSTGHCNTLPFLSRLGLKHFLPVSSLSTLLLLLTQTKRNLHPGRRLMGFRCCSLPLFVSPFASWPELRPACSPHGLHHGHEPVYLNHLIFQGQ